MLILTVLILAWKLAQAQNSWQCQLCTPLLVKGVPVHSHCFKVIYVFGDSLEDTGNLATLFPFALPPPYGVTNPGCPKGRFSDGALLIDYIAHAFGLQTTRPFLNCTCGTNFAFAGATALSIEFYEKKNISTIVPVSFDNETEWFFDYKSAGCPLKIPKSLFVIGGGGNDYTVAVLANQTPPVIIHKLVPLVVHRIVAQVKLSLANGAKTVLVENIPQTSCTPLYLDLLTDKEGVNKFGCLINYGRIVEAHNALLHKAILGLKLPKGVSVVIADRFRFLYDVLGSPLKYGFTNTDDACCGGGGEHNARVPCAAPNATLCEKPSKYVYFDAVHFTDNFNRQEALAFIVTRKYLISNYGRMLSLFDLCL